MRASMGRPRQGLRHRQSNAGFSILDVLIALTVLGIGVGAMTSALFSTRALSQSQAERTRAIDAATSVMERLKATAFDEVFVRFDTVGTNDPDGDGTAPGANFSVDGFTALEGDADGFVGLIEFPTTGTALREDVQDAALGMPRDLDLDGSVDAADHAGNYAVLPVRVTIQWTGMAGEQRLHFVSALTNRD